MKIILPWVLAAGIVFPGLSGCNSKTNSPAASADAKTPPAADQAGAQDSIAASAAPTTTDVISSARSSLKAGNVDDAAAKLAQLQLQRASFNAQQAKDYRQALSEAYDRAMEAAQRGDPKAQAAIQLLRSAAPR
jgi:hypothetical protein